MKTVFLLFTLLVGKISIASASTSYVCSFDNGDSQILVKYDIASGTGTSTLTQTDTNKPETSSIIYSASVNKEFCAGLASQGKDCNDYVVLCGAAPSNTVTTVAQCLSQGLIAIDKVNGSQSAVIGQEASEANCTLQN